MEPISRRLFLHTAGAAGLWAGTFAEDDTAKHPKSPFLKGNYAPVREEITAENLKVIGKLPAELEGMFIRTGPNPQFEPKGDYHWFDGDGMLHGVRIQGGKASYRNRYVRTEGWEEEHRAGKALYNGLLGLPDVKKIAEGKEGFKNTANTALIWYNGQLLALWEGGAPHAIQVPSLKTKGRYTFGDKLRHACTAHPRIDPTTREFLFFGYQPVKPYVQYSVANAKGEIVRTTPIDIPRPVMMHDFAITAKHTLFLDLPVTFNFTRLIRGLSPFGYDPKHGARVGILPRLGKGSEIKWFAVDPCYVFHTLNAYDDGNEVVLLACRMPEFPKEITPPDQMSAKELKVSGTMLHRWRFDLKTGKVREQPLDEIPADFPRINESHTGKPTRYGYLMTLRMDALVKYDLQKGTNQRHEMGKGRKCGEGIFVPRPDAKGEDDGWVVSYVHDEATNKSEMLIIDAQDFRSPAVARVMLPNRVPFGFHGTWVPGSALGKG